MAATKMGYQGCFYYGVYGSSATTQITNIRDKNYNSDLGMGNTTKAGDGTAVPKKTESPTELSASLDWQMLEVVGDATLEAIKTAAAAGTMIALRTKDYAAQKGFDGDVYVKLNRSYPLAGETVHSFTAMPTDDGGRVWLAYV